MISFYSYKFYKITIVRNTLKILHCVLVFLFGINKIYLDLIIKHITIINYNILGVIRVKYFTEFYFTSLIFFFLECNRYSGTNLFNSNNKVHIVNILNN